MSCHIISCDTETTGLNVWLGDRPFATSMFDLERDKEWYWEWVVSPFTRVPRVKSKDKREIQSVINEAHRIPFFNAKFDVRMLKTIGIEVPLHKIEEVSFMAKACNSMDVHRGLNALAKDYYGIEEGDEEELHSAVIRLRRIAKKLGWKIATKEDKGDKAAKADKWLPFTMSTLRPDLCRFDKNLCRIYAVQDARRTSNLREMYMYGMDEYKVRGQYDEAMRLWPHVFDMEERGVAVDMGILKSLGDESRAVVATAEEVINKAAGKKLNPNAPAQVAWLIEEKLGLEVTRRTKGGMAKTDAETLMRYSNTPSVHSVLEHRANSKALSTFFDKYHTMAIDDPSCGHNQKSLHPDFRQWGTITNRFSCAAPNLQQVSDPNTTNSRSAEFVVNVRVAFVPRRDHIWYCIDYSQLEVIIFADVSGEPTMLEALASGVDIHSAVTEKVWGGEDNPRCLDALLLAMNIAHHKYSGDIKSARSILREHNWQIVEAELSLKTKDAPKGLKTHRKLAKAVTFTKIFGGGTGALMSWVGCNHGEAKVILTDYGNEFPTMRIRMKQMEHQAKTDGFITNSYGLRITVDPHRAYAAINWQVQSDAACLMKRGMRKCGEYLAKRKAEEGLRARMIMTVHDELVFEIYKRHANLGIVRKLAGIMEDNEKVFSVKTPVEIEVVRERWSESEKVKVA